MPAIPGLAATASVDRVEAPVTFKAYLMCAFAACGGIFYGYDTGYVSGIMGMAYVIQLYTGIDPSTLPKGVNDPAFVLPSWEKSLITSILSAGNFIGSVIGGDIADWFGRRTTILAGCSIFAVGVVLQVISTGYKLLVAGRFVAGLGIGFVSAVIVLYISEVAPRKVRGAIVSGYQFCITIGLLLAACVNYGTQNRDDSGSYRIPIALQLLWTLVLAIGIVILPDSPRYFVMKGDLTKAAEVLARLRGQPIDSAYIQEELVEIVANHEYEMSMTPNTGYFGSWANCFTGSIFTRNSNLRRTCVGTALQMWQQATGVNFIFYFGTTFFQQLGTISNPFLINLITTLVNVFSTPVSFWAVERLGRRPLMIWGALGMVICQFIVAIVGVTAGKSHGTNADGTLIVNGPAVSSMIAFICIYIFFFASTWGPGAWVVVGELFPLPIRARAIALSTASNWLWNCIIAVITPYLVGEDQADLGAKVFFLWGTLCFCAGIFAYFFVPESKGLTLEQVDKMLEEVSPRKSAAWKPHSTFAAEMGLVDGNKAEVMEVEGTPKSESV